MGKFCLSAVALLFICSFCFCLDDNELKVFISVDMEGITGVVHWEEVSRDGKDYDYFRKIMTLETNAAIAGAFEAGASEVLVRDSHGSARNILPALLDKRARLLRNWSGSYKSMMEGIDETYDAVIFIGYHAKAGTPDSTLEHTMSSARIKDVAINGISLPEAGINALIAGTFNVPVAFVAGEGTLCKQVKELFGDVDTVAVKEGIGDASIGLHPEVAQERISEGVINALARLKDFRPWKLDPPYKLVVQFKDESIASKASLYPGMTRTGDSVYFENNDITEILKAFYEAL